MKIQEYSSAFSGGWFLSPLNSRILRVRTISFVRKAGILAILPVVFACSAFGQNYQEDPFSPHGADDPFSTDSQREGEEPEEPPDEEPAEIESAELGSDFWNKVGQGMSASLNPVIIVEGVGTGFIVEWKERYFIVTNIHVLDGNSEITVRDLHGRKYPVTEFFAASDRDLAIIPLLEDPPFYFEIEKDPNETLQRGDSVVALGNSKGGSVVLATRGKFIGMGPGRIETDTPVYRGNSGGPLIHEETGRVIGVITEGEASLDIRDIYDVASFLDERSAIKSRVRYFAQRLDTVPAWEKVRLRDFYRQREMLEAEAFRLGAVIDAFLARNSRYSSSNNRHWEHEDVRRVYERYRESLNGNPSESARKQAWDTFIGSLKAQASLVQKNIQEIPFHWWYRRDNPDLFGSETLSEISQEFQEIMNQSRSD